MKNFLTLFLLLSFAFSQAVGSQSGPKQAVGGEKSCRKRREAGCGGQKWRAAVPLRKRREPSYG